MNKSPYFCFGDFEFTCGGNIGRNNCEILSAGIIICDGSYNVKERFYCTARPLKYPKLTKKCRELTHLTQEEINNSPDSNDIMRIIADLMSKYSVSKLYVWGNFDRIGMLADIRQHRKANKEYLFIQKVQSKIWDIQNAMTREMELPQAVNIEELASAFGYKPKSGTFHNAYNDADALFTIHMAVHTTDFKHNESFIKLKQSRIDKIEAARKASEEKREQLALSVSLSPEEREYFKEISDGKHEREFKDFIFARSRIIYALNKNPEAENFYLVVFSFPKDIRIIPENEFVPKNDSDSPRIARFSRYDIGGALVKFCKAKKIPVKL